LVEYLEIWARRGRGLETNFDAIGLNAREGNMIKTLGMYIQSFRCTGSGGGKLCPEVY
jgi:hypothetical protein